MARKCRSRVGVDWLIHSWWTLYVQYVSLPLSPPPPPFLTLRLCHRIILWCERSLGQMDAHVPPLLQGAAQSVAVQLASYGEGGGGAGCTVCLPIAWRLNTNEGLASLMNHVKIYYLETFHMQCVCDREGRVGPPCTLECTASWHHSPSADSTHCPFQFHPLNHGYLILLSYTQNAICVLRIGWIKIQCLKMFSQNMSLSVTIQQIVTWWQLKSCEMRQYFSYRPTSEITNLTRWALQIDTTYNTIYL